MATELLVFVLVRVTVNAPLIRTPHTGICTGTYQGICNPYSKKH